MARRELLTDDERGRLFGIPEEEAGLIRHYTLSPAEFDLAADRRGSRNRLGFAVQLCLLRYPGFGLRADEAVPAALLTYLAHQLGLPAAVFLGYSRRVQTRLDHPSQRRACQAGLNKGEARHALAQAVYAHRQGRFSDRSLENQAHRASGLNLVIAAIAYWGQDKRSSKSCAKLERIVNLRLEHA